MITRVSVPGAAAPGAALAAGPVISLAAWRAPAADLLAFDRIIHAAEERGDFELHLLDDGPADPARAAGEVLTRYQRLRPRRNASSRAAAFGAALARHRALHDASKPLVRADLDHALDTWQWVLRLEPHAGAALQLAALFHDVERLAAEADARVEHRAPDYQAFKDAHARGSARRMVQALADLPLGPGVLARAAELVAGHERPGADPELAALNDADVLSFFALNSTGYWRYFGPETTARKVAYSLRRLRPAARRWLARVRLDATIGELVAGQGDSHGE
ncbi:MAG TPA: DUF4202 family protein [Polyangia bacterium]|jgi:hypothetical protein